ncbi:cobalt-precorrin-6A reductase [Pseudooceanicola sp. HF7]|uniref:cobalt-precorrin-6A reductase n=1 Tax=Pseudooceanicola sp. HF7 TaxID=2721560 RepID=UPI001431C6C3|nr:cobalt-precorrin-6A reductase [Pseudooceanicola sp. HF7]NIZ10811.1 cobalt-precorrin-6A reductase [Pseudooceanicola sp. HF7]
MVTLVLGGTTEARELGRKLAQAGRPAIVSLAGAVQSPAPQPLPMRLGGFGGGAGFRAYLAEAGITAVLDATHPFATRITERSAAICGELGMPYALLSRPPWKPGPGDLWTEVASAADAGAHIPLGTHVFLATGRQSLPDFSGLAAGRRLTLRVVELPAQPFPHDGAYLVARPPFTAEAEEALFRELGVQWLVAKNAGGQAGRAKLDAARRLGLPVLMLSRPPVPPGVTLLRDVEEAFAWVNRL